MRGLIHVDLNLKLNLFRFIFHRTFQIYNIPFVIRKKALSLCIFQLKAQVIRASHKPE